MACNIDSEQTLAHLLRLEKERRRLPLSSHCFVGMSDLANNDARTDERAYFSAYLLDRSKYAARLGLLSQRPRLQADWLPIAARVSFEDRHRLFIEEEQELPPKPSICLIDRAGREYPAGEEVIADYVAGRIEVSGVRLTGKPYQPTQASERQNRAILEAGLLPPMLSARQRGRLDQILLAERYPTFRWHFEWDQLVVVGVPDGLTKRFVYEFKSSKEVNRMKPVAERQADLYGYFFGRKYKRMQIRDVLGGRIQTFSSPIDRANAEGVLEHYAAALKAR